MKARDKFIRRLSRIAADGLKAEAAAGATPRDALRLAAATAAAILTNAAVYVFGARRAGNESEAAAREFKGALGQFTAIARAKDQTDQASQPQETRH